MTSADGIQGPVAVDVVGCGDVARKHFAALRRLADVRIIGVCDRDRAARAAAARAAGAGASAGLSAKFQDRRPGVLHILTPPQSPCELRLATVTPRRG